jgi:hypothetical protein
MPHPSTLGRFGVRSAARQVRKDVREMTTAVAQATAQNPAYGSGTKDN